MLRPLNVALGAIVAALCLCPVGPQTVSAGTVVRMEIEELARSAELVFDGRVLFARSFRDERGLVRTEYTVSVATSFAGGPQSTRTFELPGGQLADGSGLLIPGLPRLEIGEDALLFLTREGSSGLRLPVGLAQGKLRLVRDSAGRAGLVRENVDLTLADPQTGALAPAPVPAVLAYEAVAERIRTALRPSTEGR
jgi:hypothetical protein